MRIGLVGYGRVAAVHVQAIAQGEDVRCEAVYGPSLKKGQDFGTTHGIARATDEFDEFLEHIDAVVVCSPTSHHFTQALRCLEAGKNVLVELPPCTSVSETELLWAAARASNCVIQCAHTSRFLRPYARLSSLLEEGGLGRIYEAVYVRNFTITERSWRDDALEHHAAHPVDLFLHWFGDLNPKCCLSMSEEGQIHTVNLLMGLPEEGSALVSISYKSHIPQNRLTMIGEKATLETDGFTYLRSDKGEIEPEADAHEAYEDAVKNQDLQFIRACRGEAAGVHWERTMALTRKIEEFKLLIENPGQDVSSSKN